MYVSELNEMLENKDIGKFQTTEAKVYTFFQKYGNQGLAIFDNLDNRNPKDVYVLFKSLWVATNIETPVFVNILTKYIDHDVDFMRYSAVAGMIMLYYHRGLIGEAPAVVKTFLSKPENERYTDQLNAVVALLSKGI